MSFNKQKGHVHSRTVVVDYDNSPSGMRQNFRIIEKPRDGIKVDLKLHLRAEAIVGAPYKDTDYLGTTHTNAGIVYLFQPISSAGGVKTPSNAIWSTSSDQDNSHVGWSVTYMDECFYKGTGVPEPASYRLATGSGDEDAGTSVDYGIVSIWLYEP